MPPESPRETEGPLSSHREGLGEVRGALGHPLSLLRSQICMLSLLIGPPSFVGVVVGEFVTVQRFKKIGEKGDHKGEYLL